MNTINSRIKQIRTEAKLNQKEFADILGITQSGVSYMEQSGRNVSDLTVKSICRQFSVNEEWLRSGSGNMHCAPDVFSLDRFAKDRGMSELELGILKAYFEIDPQLRTQFLGQFLKNYGIETRKSIFDGVPDTSEELERQFPPIDIHNKTAG